MALIPFGHTRCFVCGQLLQQEDDVFGTSHFIADRTHHLWKYSDAAAQRDCFVQWAHRDEFVALFNQTLQHDWRGKRLEPDGRYTERSIEDLAAWLGKEVFDAITGPPGSLPRVLVRGADWVVLNCDELPSTQTVIAKLLRRPASRHVFVAGAPGDTNLLRGTTVSVRREGNEIGSLTLGACRLSQAQLVGGRSGWLHMLEVSAFKGQQPMTGDRLRPTW